MNKRTIAKAMMDYEFVTTPFLEKKFGIAPKSTTSKISELIKSGFPIKKRVVNGFVLYSISDRRKFSRLSKTL